MIATSAARAGEEGLGRSTQVPCRLLREEGVTIRPGSQRGRAPGKRAEPFDLGLALTRIKPNEKGTRCEGHRGTEPGVGRCRVDG